MKLEKHGDQTQPSAKETPEQEDSPGGGKKPVIIYILILFIVAFMLMALSLLMHQRSNTEALGQLKDSIAAMKDTQNKQERIAELELELENAQAALAETQSETQRIQEETNAAALRLERTQEAMEWFWQLDEHYVLGETAFCQTILAEMTRSAESPMSEYLSPLALERYTEIAAALGEP